MFVLWTAAPWACRPAEELVVAANEALASARCGGVELKEQSELWCGPCAAPLPPPPRPRLTAHPRATTDLTPSTLACYATTGTELSFLEACAGCLHMK